VKVTVDGTVHDLDAVDPALSAASWLRDVAGVNSVKLGCAEGACGACVARVDGRALPTCVIPVARLAGAEVATAALVSTEPTGANLARHLIAHGGLQCGYCTPGLLCAAVELLERRPIPTRDEIRAALLGHLCRCTGYGGIVRAVEAAIEESVAA
jgi:aerobic-type carbon monoxide dehydrogenase small subunit (CoxS/CutS family)